MSRKAAALVCVQLLLSMCAGAQSLEKADRTLAALARRAGRTITARPAPQPQFVSVCGLSLCLDGKPFVIHAATTYGEMDHPKAELARARRAGVNVIELVEFETAYHDLASATSEATWKRVDHYLYEARRAGLHVILNFSSYGWALEAAGQNPVTTDWGPYLKRVADRINTLTGQRYGDDPTIALVELYGEIRAPKQSAFPLRGTTRQITDFYHRTLSQWRALDSRHLVASGGFSYLDWDSGIDWRTIMSDPNDALCEIEINAVSDRDVTVPKVSRFCQKLGKPWFLAAWSACRKKAPDFPGDIDYAKNDAQMAGHARDMTKVAQGKGEAMAAVGWSFWNLGPSRKVPSCDIGPQTPRTERALRRSER